MALHHMLRAAVQQQAAGPSDPYFYDVSLLLTGDGTNGAQNNTFLDSSTNNFTITRNGNTTQGTFSPYGNLWSNYFDGSGDWLVSSAPSMSGTWTIECWIYRTVSSTDQAICYFNAGSPASGVLVYVRSNNYIQVNNGSALSTDFDGATVPVNAWSHIAIVRNGTTTTGYLNGVSVGSHSFTPGSSNSVNIGFYASGNPITFTGYISNFRLVSGTAVYTSNFTPSTTPLTAVSGTSLLTCQSNRFKDNSSNNFTLTVNGNTSVQRFSPFNPTAPYSAATIGGSGYFDGSGDYLRTPSNAAFAFGTGDFTIETWINPSSYPGAYACIVDTWNGSGDPPTRITYNLVSSKKIEVYSTGVQISSTSIIPLNVWTHVALVRSSGTMKLYINGVQDGSVTFTNNLTDSTGTIGANGAAGGPFSGYITNARLVKGTAVYTSNFTPPTTPLTAVSGTSLLCNFTNAGIPDAAMMNDLETVGNAQVSTSVKKYGTGSIAFDGTGDLLKFPISPNYELGAGDFTVELWFNTNASQNYKGIVSFGWLYGNWSTLLIQQNGLNVDLYASSNGSSWDVVNGSTIGTVSTGTWYHIAVCRSSGTIRGYFNGTQAFSVSTSATLYSMAARNLAVGAGTDGNYSLNGYIDDLRITKGYARYTSSFTPPTAALPTY